LAGHVHSGNAKGEWGKLGPLNAYGITGNRTYPRAILYLHDAFGMGLPNSQFLAGLYCLD
jgi:hypothetical protein